MTPPKVSSSNEVKPKITEKKETTEKEQVSAAVLVDSSAVIGGMPAAGHAGGFVWGGELGAHGVNVPVGGSVFIYHKFNDETSKSYIPYSGNGVTYFGIKPAVNFYPGYDALHATGVFGSIRLGLPLGLKVQDSTSTPSFVVGLSLDASVLNFIKVEPGKSVGFSLGGLGLSLLASPIGEQKSISGLISVNLNPVGMIGGLF